MKQPSAKRGRTSRRPAGRGPGAERGGLPLSLRVPGPPRPFVGRAAELARLAAVEGDGARVVVVAGQVGVGKTALVCEHLARTGHADRAIRVDLGEDDAPLVTAIAAALRAAGAPDGDDPDVAWLVDTASALDAVVLLDGLERVHSGAEALLEALARYSRRGRWWCTTRTLRPHAVGGLVVVPVPELSAAEARCLDRDRVGEEATSRVPWRLVGDPAVTPGLVPSGLPALLEGPLRPLAVHLACGHASTPRAVAERVVANDGALATAVARGMIEDVGDHLSLAPEVAAWVGSRLGAPSADDRARWLDAWRREASPAGQLEAFRAAVELGAMDEARRVIETSGAAILDAGLGLGLWSVIAPLSDPALLEWRDLVAVDAGALDELDADALADLPTRCARAKLLGFRGRHQDAADEAIGAYEAAGDLGDTACQAKAALVLVASWMHLGRFDEVEAFSRTVTPEAEVDRLMLLGFRVAALCSLDRADEARAELLAALPPADEPASRLPILVRQCLGSAAYILDERAAAARLFAPELDTSVPAELVPVRFGLIHLALVALDDGRLSDARDIVRRLGGIGGTPTYIDHHALLVALRWFVAMGQLSEADRLLVAIEVVPRRSVDEMRLGALRAQIALWRGEAPREPCPAVLPDAPNVGQIAAARLHLRHGEPSWPSLPRWMSYKRRSRRALPLRLRAEHALLAGQPEVARREAIRARQEAERHRYGLVAADLWHLLADVLLVLGDRDGARDAAAALHAAAERTGSPRLAADARFVDAVSGPALDWAVLDALAAAPEPSFTAFRRARALLAWPDVRLDRVDARVLAAVRGERSLPRVVTRDPAPTWGLDHGRRDVWTGTSGWLGIPPDGVGWRLLERIAEGGGRVRDAELLRSVWGVTSYAPHHHDNRLQVAVYRLRRALAGGGASGDDHLLRDGDGYALGGRCVIVAAAPD